MIFKTSNILLIGKFPPPIGGVTGYNKRLVLGLQKEKVKHKVIVLNKLNKNNLYDFFKSKVIHISLSNTFIKLLIVIISKLFFKKIVTTLHGSYGRFTRIKNFLELIVIQLSNKTLLLNANSYNKLKKYKSKIILSSSNFEINQEYLSENLKKITAKETKGYDKVFCTNSWKLTFDKAGNEIYSISKLVKFFKKCPNYFLIVSDPSGSNEKYILEKLKFTIPKNVLFITEDHPFTEILKLSNGFIRATTTDGDALSVREAIKLKIPVFASDVVDRPNECILFNLDSLTILLKKLLSKKDYLIRNTNESNNKKLIEEIIDVYKMLM